MREESGGATSRRLRHYATTGPVQVFRQISYALAPRDLVQAAKFRVERLERDEQRIARQLGRELRDLDVLVIGPGQQLKEARYFGRANRVTTLDLDEIPRGLDAGAYARMIKKNGFGRFAKTVGRKLLGVDRGQEAAWREALEVAVLPEPRMVTGDACDFPEEIGPMDVIVSWSVFQAIPDPAPAIRNIANSLRPGGVFYIGVHLYTSNTGHHDIRAFTGKRDVLPAWAHLRESTRHLVTPSAYLNHWRLDQWRDLLREHAPGHVEFIESYNAENLRKELTEEVRMELQGYSEEELLAAEVYFLWQKPRNMGE